MTRRLLGTYLTITGFVLVVLIIPLGRTFAAREQDRLISAIERDATVIAGMSEEGLEEGQPLGLDLLLARYAQDPGGRIVIVDAGGISVADSDNLDGPPRDFSTRPEFIEALAGRVDRGIRSSETLGKDLIFVAVPAGSGGSVLGAVRITYPATTLEDSVRDNWLRLGVLSLVVLAAVTIVGFTLARSVTRPVRALEETAASLSAGDLAARVTVSGPPEIRELGRTFNETADWLEALIDSQRGFVADASHQLRTPLTALRLRLENLRYAVDPADLPAVEAALSETGRLTRLVDGLLALARAEAEHAPRQVIDLTTIAADRAGAWEPLASDGAGAADAGRHRADPRQPHLQRPRRHRGGRRDHHLGGGRRGPVGAARRRRGAGHDRGAAGRRLRPFRLGQGGTRKRARAQHRAPARPLRRRRRPPPTLPERRPRCGGVPPRRERPCPRGGGLSEGFHGPDAARTLAGQGLSWWR